MSNEGNNPIKWPWKLARNRVTIIFLALLTGVSVCLVYLMVKPFLKPILSAAVIAVATFPVHAWIYRRVRNSTVAALLSTVLVILVVVIPGVVLGRAITEELKGLYQAFSEKSAAEGGVRPYFMNLVARPPAWLARRVHILRPELAAALRGRLEQAITYLLTLAAGVVSNVTALLVNAVIAFFVLFFLFRDGRSMRRRVAALLPLRADQVSRLFRAVNDTVMATVYGVLGVALVQGALTGLAFWALGLPSPVLWSLVTGIFCLVPVVGTAAVWAPASIILAVSGQWWKGLILVAWGAGVVHPVDNIVRPYVIGERVKISALYLFFALLGGLEAFGVIGLFVGPIIFSITLALFGFLREEVHTWQRDRRNGDLEPTGPAAFHDVAEVSRDS